MQPCSRGAAVHITMLPMQRIHNVWWELFCGMWSRPECDTYVATEPLWCHQCSGKTKKRTRIYKRHIYIYICILVYGLTCSSLLRSLWFGNTVRIFRVSAGGGWDCICLFWCVFVMRTVPCTFILIQVFPGTFLIGFKVFPTVYSPRPKPKRQTNIHER